MTILTRSGDNPEAHPPFIRFGFGRCNVDNASAATTTPYNGDTVSWYDTNDVKNDCDIDTATTVATLRQKQLRQRLDRVLLRQGHRQESAVSKFEAPIDNAVILAQWRPA
eukprot:634301_1